MLLGHGFVFVSVQGINALQWTCLPSAEATKVGLGCCGTNQGIDPPSGFVALPANLQRLGKMRTGHAGFRFRRCAPQLFFAGLPVSMLLPMGSQAALPTPFPQSAVQIEQTIPDSASQDPTSRRGLIGLVSISCVCLVRSEVSTLSNGIPIEHL